MEKKIIFALLFAIFTAVAPATAQPKTETVKIETSAVCGMCKKTIENALLSTKGVKAANLDLETKVVTVTYRTKNTGADAIRAAITKTGYKADAMPADPVAYEKLHFCCKADYKHD